MSRTTLPTLAILGCVRNGGGALSETLSAIEHLGELVDVRHILIGTNDNTDQTDDVLADLEQNRSAVRIIRLDGLAEAVGKRTTRIATVRNIVLSHHWEQPPADFTLVLDLDGPNADLPVKRIAELVKGAGPEDWLGIFPCQNEAYYDLFALRHPMWCPWDLRKRYRLVRIGTLGLVPASHVKRSMIYGRQYRIPDTAPPIPVHSAFGGLGLYRTDAIRGCWYNGTSRTGSSICEHVAFNHMISRGRPGLFIDPALRNLAPEEHLGPGSGQPFPNEYSQP